MSRIDYISSVIWILPPPQKKKKKIHLPVRQVENRILLPNRKIH